MDAKTEILRAKDLSKTFSNESVQQHVLKNLNLSIYKGDFTVIMGNSGSGKSTLLYALSGMDRPSLGTITYFVEDEESGKNAVQGVEISKYSNDKLAKFRRNHVGFVFQQNYLNDSMSALDNVLRAFEDHRPQGTCNKSEGTVEQDGNGRERYPQVSDSAFRRSAAESCRGKRRD